MAHTNLFESFKENAYDNTTDPFASILEGPKFTFGDAPEDTPSGDSTDSDELGKASTSTVESDMTEEELEAARIKDSELSGDELVDAEEPSDLEKQADDVLHADSMYDPMSSLNAQVTSAEDAMNFVDDIGEFDIAAFEDPEFGISGEELVRSDSVKSDDMDLDTQFGLDDPEAVIGEDEPVLEDPAQSPDSDIIALSNISDEELIKELQHRMLLKNS